MSLTYRTGVDDPGRFARSKALGAYFGLTPKRHQSGEADRVGSITKAGDAGVRTALYEAANVLLTRIANPRLVESVPSRRPRVGGPTPTSPAPPRGRS